MDRTNSVHPPRSERGSWDSPIVGNPGLITIWLDSAKDLLPDDEVLRAELGGVGTQFNPPRVVGRVVGGGSGFTWNHGALDGYREYWTYKSRLLVRRGVDSPEQSV